MATLRALRPHTYANRRLSEGDVYHPEKPMHATLLVAFGHATLCDETGEFLPISGLKTADLTQNQGKLRKKRGRPKKKIAE